MYSLICIFDPSYNVMGKKIDGDASQKDSGRMDDIKKCSS